MGYRGETVNLPVGQQGFSGARNPSKMGPGHFSYVDGVDIDGGILVKEGGASKFNSTALGDPSVILAGTNWSPMGGTRNDVVFLDNGDVLKDTGAGTFGTTVASAVNTPSVYPPSWATGGGETVGADRKLFLFSDGNQVMVLPGTSNTMAAIDDPAADWTASFPIFGTVHDQRLWAGGNANDPHRMYYSQIADHENFIGAGSGSLSVYPGEGEIIVGAVSFRGLLLVYKHPRGIYVIDTRDPDIANWQVQRLNNAVGAAGPGCILQISNDIMILDVGGNIHLMTAVNDFGDVQSSNIGRISEMSTFMRDNVSLLGLHKACSVWHANKSQAYFHVPLSGSSVNGLRILVDQSDPQAGVRYLLSRRDEAASMWIKPDGLGIERPTIGDYDGFVWMLDDEARNKDGDPYAFAFDTADTDFSFADPNLAGKSKNGQFLEIVADLINNTTIDVTPYWDGLPSDPIPFTLGGVGAVLGSFILGTDALGFSGIVTRRERLTGQGRRLRLSVENNELDNDVRLNEFRVEFTIADERTSNE